MSTINSLNPLPDGLIISEQGSQTLITRKWYKPSVWLLFIFCLFWIAFMFNWYSIALSRPSTSSIAIWFPMLHVGAGIYLFYRSLTGFFNTTYFTIGGEKIDIRHGPFPWPGNKSVDTALIQQLFCDEITRYGRGGMQSRYRLNAVMSDGRKVTLLGAGLERDQALYIEKFAEEKLGIKAIPVVGELN